MHGNNHYARSRWIDPSNPFEGEVSWGNLPWLVDVRGLDTVSESLTYIMSHDRLPFLAAFLVLSSTTSFPSSLVVSTSFGLTDYCQP
jgi:hypothetical protein